MNFFKTAFAISKRLRRPLPTSKSSEAMLPDISSATTMSTPLALTLVSLLVSRGWASAIMNNPRANHRKAASNPPERERVTLSTARTSCTEE